MFDFDDLEDEVAIRERGADDTSGASNCEPVAIEAEVTATTSPAAPAAPDEDPEPALSPAVAAPAELPTARYHVGMSIESVGPAIVRGAELLDSELVKRVPAISVAEVMEIGSGPTGKRIRVRVGEEAVEGWVSVIAENQAPLWRPSRAQATRPPAEEAAEEHRRKAEEDEGRRTAEAAQEEERQRRRKEVEAEFAAEAPAGWHAAAASAARRPTDEEVADEAAKRAEEAKARQQREEQEYRPALDAAEALHRQSQGVERHTSRFAVGDACESVTTTIMRRGELLDSTQVKRLAANIRLEVLQIGTGPTGKRIQVREDGGQTGWVSVIAESGVALVRVVQRAPVSVIGKDGVVRKEERAGPIAEVDGPPNALFDAGDLCVSERDFLAMTRNEGLDSPTVARLPPGTRIEVLRRGIGASGNRIRAQCVEGGVAADLPGTTGWISVVAEGGRACVKILRKKNEPELWVGAGQSLGGSESAPMSEAERKAARLKAVEARMSQGAQRGVSEQAAKKIEEKQRQERLRTKINELYARRREEPPMSLQSASGDALQKHLDWLTQEPPPTSPASPGAQSSSGSRGYPGTGFVQPYRPAPAPAHAAVGAAGSGVATGSLSASEREDVQTLESMGFGGQLALQAFMASGRNVELAADLLLQGGPLDGPGIRVPPPDMPPTPSPAEVRNVSLTMSEHEAVQRLSELGFTKEAALREFVACGKNEELAGNRLLQ